MLHSKSTFQKKAPRLSHMVFHSFAIACRNCSRIGFVYTSYPPNSANMEMTTGIQKRNLSRRLCLRYILAFSLKTKRDGNLEECSISLYSLRNLYLGVNQARFSEIPKKRILVSVKY